MVEHASGPQLIMTDWKGLNDEILRYRDIICTKPLSVNGRRREARDRLATELRTRASLVWWPTLQRLKAAHLRDLDVRPDVELVRRGVLADWERFGASLELNSASERKRFMERELTSYCSWDWCEYHIDKPPNTVPLKSCKGCGEVKYCSRACQVR